jgi:DNA-binding transcriptional ArsR family regulator
MESRWTMQDFELVEAKGFASAEGCGSQARDAAVLDIGQKAAFAVVASPLRMRIFEIIRRAGPCSVRELSAQSGLSATGLYYHLQALEQVELIRHLGVRKGEARRAPKVYAATCEVIRVLFDPENDGHRSRMATIRRRWNHESMRSLEDAMRRYQDGRVPQVRQRYEWEHLTPDEIDAISGLLAKVEAVCHRARSRGNLIPDTARPVHLGLSVLELPAAAMPSPLMQPEGTLHRAKLRDLSRRVDEARDLEAVHAT